MTDTANQSYDETISKIAWLYDLVTGKIPLWIAAVVIFFIFILVAKIVRKIVEAKLADSVDEDHEEVQILGGRIAYATVMTLGATMSLKIAGIDLTTILAAVAFGIGFALKDLIMNFLAGIFILISRHFSIGDFIKVGSTLGKIVEIQTRNTILQAIDGTKVIVPNANLFTKEVISFTSNPFRRIEVLVGVDYRQNLENVVKVCTKAIKSTKGVLIEPKPAVVVDKFGESSIDLKLRAWVESRSAWLKIKSNLVINVKKEFDAYGITIPWPIRTVAYDKDQEIVEKIMEEEEAKEHYESTLEAEPVVTNETPVVTAPAAETVAVKEDNEEAPPLKPLGER